MVLWYRLLVVEGFLLECLELSFEIPQLVILGLLQGCDAALEVLELSCRSSF
jgi:hypothetical protein